ncbi:hypothetical protein MASR2M15_11960 [Anaerolineales bacterium]
MLKTLSTRIHLDLLLSWRQRTVMIGVSLFTVILLGYLLLSSSLITSESTDFSQSASTRVLFSLFPLIHLFATLILPLLLIDSFARDKYYDVTELFEALPLSNKSYLLGKTLAIFITALISMLFLAVVVGVMWWILIYPFDISSYIQAWLINLIPIAGLNCALLALCTMGQPNRKRTLYLGLGFVFISLIGMISFSNPENPILYYLNPGRTGMLIYYFEQTLNETVTSTLAMRLLIVLVAFLEVAVLFFIQLWNLNRKR